VIRVLVVGDVAAVRFRTCTRLMPARGIEVAGQAGFGPDLPRVVTGARADVALVHLRPGQHGRAAVGDLVGGAGPAESRLMVVASRADPVGVVVALRSGACGFVYADADAAEMAASVRAAASGKQLPNAAGLGELMASLPGRRPRPPLARWSAVERQMVGLIAAGASNSEVAAALEFHPATTFAHINHLMARVGASGLMQLVLYAYDHGLIAAGAGRPVAA
jgi:DNA-binding NarL/FixJ family response regulator